MAVSDQLDAVYIASPNSFHADQAITLLNHGKHVLCEKPFASNAAEVELMIAAAKRNDVLLMEAIFARTIGPLATCADNIPG